MSYEDKYLKYKSKYLALKNQLGSGEKSAKDIFVKAYARIPDQVSTILNNDKPFLTFDNIPTELDSIFDQIWTKTGTDKSTIDWIIKSYVNNTFGVPSSLENLGRFKDSIKKYNVLHANIDGIKPIHEITGLVELERFIEDNEYNFKKIEEKKTKQKRKIELQKKIKDEGEDDKEVIFETDKVIIYKPTTENGARYYGRNTTWCTAATENSMFNYYNRQGPLYIIQSKSDIKDKYQLHIESNQFMNNKDAPVSVSDIKIHFNDKDLNIWFNNIFEKIIMEINNKANETKKITLDSLLVDISNLSDLAINNLETLELGWDFNLPLGNSLDKLTNLQTLIIGDTFNQQLGNSLDKLTNLQTLNFGVSFNQSLGNSLDKLTKLHTLTFKSNYSQPITHILSKLPNLKTLYYRDYLYKY
jgi:hypothetical protein